MGEKSPIHVEPRSIGPESAGPQGQSNGVASFKSLAECAAQLAISHRDGPPTSSRPNADTAQLRALLDVGLPEGGRDGHEVIEQLATAAQPGLVGNTGPDFFAWVMGASHPVGVAADWLTAAWGQNAAIYATAPAAAIAEEAASRWLVDLLRLPSESSVGFATGATMASFTCLAAARSAVLHRSGYDLESHGLIGAPPTSVFVGEDAHTTIFSALRYLGFGRKDVVPIAADGEGRMRSDDLRAQLERREGAKIVIGQAGHINSGAFDPFLEIAELARSHDAWLHVDGAFGLWARAVPEFSGVCEGVDKADSWSVDGHKWLQVPYDSGFAIVRDEHAHKRAMDTSASYISEKPGDGRNPTQYGPELSRRARGFAVWAVIQALGRRGIADLISRHCQLARHLRDALAAEPDIVVMNEVVLNQLAIRFNDLSADADRLTERIVEEVQSQGGSFVESAEWQGRRILRVSIISHDTRQEHVDRLADAIIAAWKTVKANEPSSA